MIYNVIICNHILADNTNIMYNYILAVSNNIINFSIELYLCTIKLICNSIGYEMETENQNAQKSSLCSFVVS